MLLRDLEMIRRPKGNIKVEKEALTYLCNLKEAFASVIKINLYG